VLSQPNAAAAELAQFLPPYIRVKQCRSALWIFMKFDIGEFYDKLRRRFSFYLDPKILTIISNVDLRSIMRVFRALFDKLVSRENCFERKFKTLPPPPKSYGCRGKLISLCVLFWTSHSAVSRVRVLNTVVIRKEKMYIKSRSLWRWYIIQILCFCGHYPSSCLYFKTTFRRLNSVSVFR
jgi:hypothetical protein